MIRVFGKIINEQTKTTKINCEGDVLVPKLKLGMFSTLFFLLVDIQRNFQHAQIFFFTGYLNMNQLLAKMFISMIGIWTFMKNQRFRFEYVFRLRQILYL